MYTHLSNNKKNPLNKNFYFSAEKAAAAIAAIPVPPSPTLSSKSTNREAVPSNAPSNVTTPRKEEAPKVIQPQVSINEVKQVQLKPVNRVQV